MLACVHSQERSGDRRRFNCDREREGKREKRIERKVDRTHLGCKVGITQLVEQVHGLTVAVAADYDVPDVIHHAAQLQCRRLTAEVLVLKVLGMWYQISSITH